MVRLALGFSGICLVLTLGSVVPGSVQVPENWTCGKKSIRTGPGTARKSKSVLEPEPKPPNAVCQF